MSGGLKRAEDESGAGTQLGRDALERYRREISDELRARGVDTVPEVVDLMVAGREAQRRNRFATPVPIGRRPRVATPPRKSLVHRPPRVPLYIDAVARDPADISRFDGQRLVYVASKSADAGEHVLHVLTPDYVSFVKGAVGAALQAASTGIGRGRLGLLEEWNSAQGSVGRHYPTSPADPNELVPFQSLDDGTVDYFHYTDWNVQMFHHDNYESDWFWLSAGYEWPDLRQVHRGGWLSGSNWNDAINSLGGTNTWVGYFWDINFQGNVLIVPPGYFVPDLGVFGWANAISSVINTGNDLVRAGGEPAPWLSLSFTGFP
jgi:hypothetical protein